jgi:hypothetical protein
MSVPPRPPEPTPRPDRNRSRDPGRPGRDRAAREARRLEALHLRLAGWDYDTIARQLGFRHRSSAYRLVQAALAARQREAAPAVRALELARLDALLERVWPRAMAGHLPAVDRVLAILDRRARLLGLLAPERAVAVVDVAVVTREAHILAARYGLDVGELLREAERIARALAAGPERDAAVSWDAIAQGRAGGTWRLPPEGFPGDGDDGEPRPGPRAASTESTPAVPRAVLEPGGEPGEGQGADGQGQGQGHGAEQSTPARPGAGPA